MSPVGAPASQLQRGVRLGGVCRSYPFRRTCIAFNLSPMYACRVVQMFSSLHAHSARFVQASSNVDASLLSQYS
eukprot:6011999-Alexandrium_andersonii.AAC.1